MNIKEAKKQIKNAVIAYRTRNAYGQPMLPLHKQRPVFLIGAPGIGKTAIMEQIAQELGILLVSYSITHHTRQSALGLPFISEKEFEGKKWRVSEYTMSEIIGSIYQKMEETGRKEGILFLDEINCVSETLTPAMLQFLQYKVFGQHRVPEGWVIVTAGNPPEYNQSVREFDMVTQDRLKKIEVEPDYETWREWAVQEEIVPSVLSYLDLRREDFYRVEMTIDGRSFVTPRGWADLSNMMKLYELNQIEVDEFLIGQYLQNEQVSRQFFDFYQLWKKYEKEYRLQDILLGKEAEPLILRASQAPFDERISLIGLLLDAAKGEMKEAVEQRQLLLSVKKLFSQWGLGRREQETERENTKMPEDSLAQTLTEEIMQLEDRLSAEKRELCSEKEQLGMLALLDYLKKSRRGIEKASARQEERELLMARYQEQAERLQEKAAIASKKLENVFAFCEQAFGKGSEMLLLVTELTSSKVCARFISQYGCEKYFQYNKELLFYERNKRVLDEIEELI